MLHHDTLYDHDYFWLRSVASFYLQINKDPKPLYLSAKIRNKLMTSYIKTKEDVIFKEGNVWMEHSKIFTNFLASNQLIVTFFCSWIFLASNQLIVTSFCSFKAHFCKVRNNEEKWQNDKRETTSRMTYNEWDLGCHENVLYHDLFAVVGDLILAITVMLK